MVHDVPRQPPGERFAVAHSQPLDETIGISVCICVGTISVRNRRPETNRFRNAGTLNRSYANDGAPRDADAHVNANPNGNALDAFERLPGSGGNDL